MTSRGLWCPRVAAALLVTGANGRLGRSLIRAVAGRRPVRALVRSERAAASLRALPHALRPEIVQVDWADADALARAGAGASDWVHLVGILKETRTSRYADAHERPARALARGRREGGRAAPGRGEHPRRRARLANACLASKGRADADAARGRRCRLRCCACRWCSGRARPAPSRCARRRARRSRSSCAAAPRSSSRSTRATWCARSSCALEAPVEREALDLGGPGVAPAPRAGGARRRAARAPPAHRAAAARRGLRARLRCSSAARASRRSRARCSACSSTTTASTRAPACLALGLALTPLERRSRWTFLEAENRVTDGRRPDPGRPRGARSARTRCRG